MGTKTVAGSHARLLVLLVALLAASCALIALEAQPAYALKASGGAKAYKLQPYTTYTKFDITGDKVPDKIEVGPWREWDDWYEEFNDLGVEVTVNDRIVYRKSTISTNPFDWDIRFITLKSKKALLYVATHGLDGYAADVNAVLAWKTGKLKCVLNANSICSGKYLYGSYPSARLTKISSNMLTFDYGLKVMMTGNTTFNASYKYKSGKFVRTSSYVKPKIGGKYGKARTALKSLTVYKNASCKSKKFTIKKGQKVKLLKMYVKGSKMVLQVKVGSRTGWVKCATSQHSKLLVAPGEPPLQGIGVGRIIAKAALSLKRKLAMLEQSNFRINQKMLIRAGTALAFLIAAVGLNALGPQEACAVTATGGASICRLEPFVTYTEYDITGDGKCDKIEIYPTSLSENSDLLDDLSDSPVKDNAPK